jgi:hypothetical protein
MLCYLSIGVERGVGDDSPTAPPTPEPAPLWKQGTVSQEVQFLHILKISLGMKQGGTLESYQPDWKLYLK